PRVGGSGDVLVARVAVVRYRVLFPPLWPLDGALAGNRQWAEIHVPEGQTRVVAKVRSHVYLPLPGSKSSWAFTAMTVNGRVPGTQGFGDDPRPVYHFGATDPGRFQVEAHPWDDTRGKPLWAWTVIVEK